MSVTVHKVFEHKVAQPFNPTKAAAIKSVEQVHKEKQAAYDLQKLREKRAKNFEEFQADKRLEKRRPQSAVAP